LFSPKRIFKVSSLPAKQQNKRSLSVSLAKAAAFKNEVLLRLSAKADRWK